MTRSIFAAVLSALALVGAASAADLPANQNPLYAIATAHSVNDTGFYFGAGAGTDMHKISPGVSIGLDGYALTGRVGYDYKFAKSFIVGGFGDINYSSASIGDVNANLSGDIGVRVGVVMGGTMFYAGAAEVWKDFSGVSYAPSGPLARIGMQVDLGAGFGVAIEGDRSWADTKGVTDTADSIRFVLLKKLGGN